MTKNKDCTRAYSDNQEKQVCLLLGASQTPNSGANLFRKGDCIQEEAKLLIECKTVEEDKKSVSIKKDWIEKNKEEAFRMHCDNSCIAFNFGPNQKNYFIIDEKLMGFLVDKLIDEDNN